MSCKVVKINGSEEHVFVEGDSFYVDFQRINEFIPRRNSSISGTVRRTLNKTNIRVKIKPIDKNIFEEIESQQYSDSYSETKNELISPFVEKKQKTVQRRKNTTIFKKKVGFYESTYAHLKDDAIAFNDRNSLNLLEYIQLSEDDLQNFYYPFKFNRNEFYRKSARIDVFDIVKRLKRNAFGVDVLKGAKGFALKSGVNAIKENNTIKHYDILSERSDVYFEDGILENIIYNDQDKYRLYQEDNQIIKQKVNKISNEPRFVNFDTMHYSPYNDVTYKKDIVNNDSMFFYNRARSSDLENILRSNRDVNFVFEEEKKYKSLGRSVDYSKNFGLESICYYESLD